MKKVLLALLTCYLLLMTTVCFGEEKKEEWANAAYSFKQLKTVLVQYSIQSDISLSETERQKLDDAFRASFFKNDKKQKLTYISLTAAEASLEKLLSLQLTELKETASPKYEETLTAHLPAIANAILKVTITAQNYSTVHIEQTTEIYTDYEYRTIYEPYYNSGRYAGSTARTIQVPVTKTRYVPAHDVQIAHAGAEFVLEDAKTQQPVWRLVDIREAPSKSALSMTERIFERAKGQLIRQMKRD